MHKLNPESRLFSMNGHTPDGVKSVGNSNKPPEGGLFCFVLRLGNLLTSSE